MDEGFPSCAGLRYGNQQVSARMGNATLITFLERILYVEPYLAKNKKS